MIMMEALLMLNRVVKRRNGPLMNVMRNIRAIPLMLKIPVEVKFFTRRGVAG
jgi:hypothetical protein